MTLLSPLSPPRPRSASPPPVLGASRPPRKPPTSCPPSRSSSPASLSPPHPRTRPCSTSYAARASYTSSPSPLECSRVFSRHPPLVANVFFEGRRGRHPPRMFSPAPVVWPPPSRNPYPARRPKYGLTATGRAQARRERHDQGRDATNLNERKHNAKLKRASKLGPGPGPWGMSPPPLRTRPPGVWRPPPLLTRPGPLGGPRCHGDPWPTITADSALLEEGRLLPSGLGLPDLPSSRGLLEVGGPEARTPNSSARPFWSESSLLLLLLPRLLTYLPIHVGRIPRNAQHNAQWGRSKDGEGYPPSSSGPSTGSRPSAMPAAAAPPLAGAPPLKTGATSRNSGAAAAGPPKP